MTTINRRASPPLKRQKRQNDRKPSTNTRNLPLSKSSSQNSGGSPISDVERRLRVRSMLPIQLDYDPFKDSEALKRLLSDLAGWVLAGRIHHRVAGAIRGLVKQWIEVDEHSRLDEIEKRIEELEAKQH